MVSTAATLTIPSEQALAARRDPERQPLRHVMIVGGTLAEWHDLGDSRWSARVDELGGVAAHAGASFLTVRAYEPGDDPVDLPRWTRQVGECLVIVDPCGDGRQRFADAVATIPSHEPINEAIVSEVLYAPADCEPDLIVVLGEPTQLPPSVVWELAYGELSCSIRSAGTNCQVTSSSTPSPTSPHAIVVSAASTTPTTPDESALPRHRRCAADLQAA